MKPLAVALVLAMVINLIWCQGKEYDINLQLIGICAVVLGLVAAFRGEETHR